MGILEAASIIFMYGIGAAVGSSLVNALFDKIERSRAARMKNITPHRES